MPCIPYYPYREQKQIPDEWKKSSICSIYMQGDTLSPQNYRKIALLCTAYKVLTDIYLQAVPYKKHNFIISGQLQYGKINHC
jgi:hypothetical protein